VRKLQKNYTLGKAMLLKSEEWEKPRDTLPDSTQHNKRKQPKSYFGNAASYDTRPRHKVGSIGLQLARSSGMTSDVDGD